MPSPTSAGVRIAPQERQRLLLFNLRTDADDHILGFTTRWINELAPYYTQIDVLTTHAGRLAVAENVRVYSVGRERGTGRIGRLRRFYSILWHLLITHRYDACFAHMQPLFAVLAAPLLGPAGVRITTWYTHRERTPAVVWATRASYRVVSAVESSFPVQTPKLRAIGHGIDTRFFQPADHPTAQAHPRIVYVARLTEIKAQHRLLEAAQPLDCEIILVGDVPDGYDAGYKRHLQQLVKDLNLVDRVRFAGPQTPQQVRDWLVSADVAVNLSPPGLFDKAALEAMACGVPTIVANAAFRPVMGVHHEKLAIQHPVDSAALRHQLAGLLATSREERRQIGSDLRTRVLKQHSLQQLAIRLIQVMHEGEFSR